MTAQSTLSRYASAGCARVEGWLDVNDVQVLLAINEIQQGLEVSGHVGEIGVHHGKLFILLYLMRRPGERAVAVDIFDDQEANVDGSGLGCRATFLANLMTHAGNADNAIVIQKPSTELGLPEIAEAAGGPMRLFSIDGGHTADITYNDFSVVAAAMAPGGVIILDDYFNSSWPGVSEGTNRFVRDHPKTVFPFAISANKVMFSTSSEQAERYHREISKHDFGGRQRMSTLFGSPVVCYEWPTLTFSDRIARTGPWRRFRASSAGRITRRLLGRET